MSKPARVFVSSEAKVRNQERWSPLLRAYGEVFGAALRSSYVKLVVHAMKRQDVRHSLITSGWKEDEADSIIDTALASQEAAVESTKLALQQARAALRETQRKLDWAMAGNSSKRSRQRHGLARRCDILRSRGANFERRLAHDGVRVCFWGRKLALAGNDPVAHGYVDRPAWREAWQRSRSGVIYVKGDAQATYGKLLCEDHPRQRR